MTAWLAVSCSL